MSTGRQTTHNPSLIVAFCVAIVVSMVGLAYAAVPLYTLFCQVTGFGGTTQVATAAPGATGGRLMTIRFDANVESDLAWEFRPETPHMEVRLGESALGFYRATSLADRETVGTATFNVTPLAAGQYFNKVECFCFTEQRLSAGESAELPVSFFIDPQIEDDRDLDGVTTITLSYTYFQSDAGSGQTSLDAGAVPGQAEIN